MAPRGDCYKYSSQKEANKQQEQSVEAIEQDSPYKDAITLSAQLILCSMIK
jgi:hypothetical protein